MCTIRKYGLPPPIPAPSKTSLTQRSRFLRACRFIAACLASLLLFFPLIGLSADTIFLKNGKTVEGKFQGRIDGYYQITLKNGKVKYFPEKDIKDVQITSRGKTKSLLRKGIWASLPPMSVRLLLALGFSQAQYAESTDSASQQLSQFDDLESTDDGELTSPASNSGLALRAGTELGIFMGPGVTWQLGFDFSYLPLNKENDSLRVNGSSFQTSYGYTGQASIVTDRSYTYNYFAFTTGLSSYLQLIDLYVAYYLRVPLSGSYTAQNGSKMEFMLPSGAPVQSASSSAKLKGSIKGKSVGFGFVVQKKAMIKWGSLELDMNFLYSTDMLELKGEEGEREEELVFYGLGLSIDF